MIELERADEDTPLADLQGQRLAADAARILERHYPGYRWKVLVDEIGGMLTIVNQTLLSPLPTHELYGWTLYLSRVYQDPDLKCIVMAGGALLERANLDRKAWDEHTLPKKIEGIQDKHQPLLDANGNPVVI